VVSRIFSVMRWDRLTLTAFGGIAAFLIGAALLLNDGRSLFAPVIGNGRRHRRHDARQLRGVGWAH
jgi:hypothetical protein